MGLFDFFKKTQVETPRNNSSRAMSFSTPFYKIGKGNLTAPYVSSYYTTEGYVRFGIDNLFPQLLNQLSHQSPLHGAIIQFMNNAITGGGYEWKIPASTGRAKVDILTYERRNKFRHLVRLLSRDILIHNRVTCIMCRQEDGTYTIKRIDPSNIRHNTTKTLFSYSEDWSKGLLDAKIYPCWKPGTTEKESMFYWGYESAGQDIYPLPLYHAMLNWAALDSEMSYLNKQNILNSVYPSAVVRVPKIFDSEDEREAFRRSWEMNRGAENAGKVMVLNGVGMEDVPEVSWPSANANDNLFTETSKQMHDAICFAWGINPSVMGIKVAGSLGNKEEIMTSYQILEKNTIIPLRKQLEEVLSELIDATGFANEVVFNNFQIVDGEIQQKTTE